MIAPPIRQNNENRNNLVPRKRHLRWHLVALGCMAILAVVAICLKFNTGNHEMPPSEKKPSKAIKSVDAEIAPRKTDETPKQLVDKPVAKPALSYAKLAEEGKTVITNKAGEEIVLSRSRRKERPRPAYAIFAHESENKIAALISIEPGTQLFGTQVYNERFKEDFMKSCEEPIIITEDDDEFTRQLKSTIIELKIELRDRMRAGEDICQIMADSRKELQRLGMVRREIEKMLKDEVRAKATSDDDIDDYIKAANILLESKGIAPIKINPVLRRSLMNAVGKQVQQKE